MSVTDRTVVGITVDPSEDVVEDTGPIAQGKDSECLLSTERCLFLISLHGDSETEKVYYRDSLSSFYSC